MDILTNIGPQQEYNNLRIVPIMGNKGENKDLMDLKTGLAMGLVEIRECVPETVNQIVVINNAVSPLIIFDGEQVKGAKQNRILNQTVIIPPKTQMEVPVSCTERGRWVYRENGGKSKDAHNFDHSSHFADAKTRSLKRRAVHHRKSVQHTVWCSIDSVSDDFGVSSKTNALLDVLESSDVKTNREDYLENFQLLENQIGALFFINDEFKGAEILNNPEIYGRYHEMILDSYIIDAMSRNDGGSEKFDILEDVLEKISNSELKKGKSVGIEKTYDAVNEDILGTIANYDDNLIHATYFKMDEDEKAADRLERPGRRYSRVYNNPNPRTYSIADRFI